MSVLSLNDISVVLSLIRTHIHLYWCHDGKRTVPVTVQVWDCLSSPLRMDLVRERVGDGSVGAIDISRSRCPGLSVYKSSALLEPVWFWSRLSTSEYPP